MELEKTRRREDQQHELRMMQMLGQMLQHRSYPQPNSTPYEYNHYDDTFNHPYYIMADTFMLLISAYHNNNSIMIHVL